jgi:hypothetical protein
MRVTPRIFVALLVAAALGATAGAAAAKPQTLKLHFQRVAIGVDGHCGNAVLTSGPYMLASLARPHTRACASRFLLIDDRTGKRTVLRPGGYATVQAFGAPWILFSHNLRAELYNIATRRWTPFRCGNGCAPDGTLYEVIGARWVEFVVQGQQSCGDGVHFECGPVTYAFYNLRTHKVRHGSPQTSTRIVDLDSPTLVRRVCKPLRAPAGESLTYEGKFVVVSEAHGSFLERCGSPRRIALGAGTLAGGGLLANPHAVMSRVAGPAGVVGGTFDGIWLPSRRRFTATGPPGYDTFGAIAALDAVRLYVAEPGGTLWAATLSQ